MRPRTIFIAVIISIALVGLLLLFGNSTSHPRSNSAKARAMIAALETAIGMFESDVGEYPSSGSSNLIKSLSMQEGIKIGNPTHNYASNRENKWHGPYIHFKENEIVDPWGTPYIYINNGSEFIIVSCGPDKKEGTRDDIRSGQQ